MSGTVFLEKIRKNLPAATRVIMTGYADIDAVIQAINLGHVFRFIKKPWDDEEFTSQINNAVEFARMNRRLMQIMDTDETGKHALQERLQGVLEMAGAVCHEFAQPLQVISGYCDLLTDTPAGERDFICMEDQLAAIQGAAERLGSLLIKVMAIRRYRTRAYLEGQRIVDIHAASEPDRGDPVPLELQNRGNSRQD
jgi:response regulator RpfG family c-di-GMP phosphodiesterase